jgi:hypothetical protein
LGGCSVINHFDDVKPLGTGGTGGSTTDATTGSSTTGEPTGAGGQIATTTASTSTTVTGSGGVATTGSGGAGGVTSSGSGGTAGTTSSGAGGLATGGSGTGTGGAAGAGGTGIADAGSDGAIRQLTCRFVFGTPSGGHIKLDDFSMYPGTSQTLGDRFFILPLLNTTTVRIMAQLNNSPDDSYFVYTANDGGSPAPRQVISSNGRLVGAQKVSPQKSVALVIGNGGFDPDSGTGYQPRLLLHTYDDSNWGIPPTVAPLTNPGQLGSTGNIDATFAPDPDGTIAIGASFDVGTGRSRATYGLYKGTPIDLFPLMEDPSQDNARTQTVVHVKGVAGYTFVGQTPQYEFEVRDDGTTMMPPRRQIATSAFMVLGNFDTAGKINLASADLGTPLMPKLALYIGQVDPLNIMTFDPASFVLAKSAASLSEVPISALNGFSDDLLYFAGPTGVAGTELSILFIDALGRTRASQKLQDTQGRVTLGSITPRGTMGGVGGKYHITWTEEIQPDTGGRYDILWYDQLDCL